MKEKPSERGRKPIPFFLPSANHCRQRFSSSGVSRDRSSRRSTQRFTKSWRALPRAVPSLPAIPAARAAMGVGWSASVQGASGSPLRLK